MPGGSLSTRYALSHRRTLARINNLEGASSHLPWDARSALFVVGAAFSSGLVIWGTLLQRRVSEGLRGRVSSLDFFISLALMPVSMAIAGPVGAALGVSTVFLIAGIAPGFLAVAAILGPRLDRDEILNSHDEVAAEVVEDNPQLQVSEGAARVPFE